jgi:hypothetical protein
MSKKIEGVISAMSDTPELMTHERIITGEEYVAYSDYLSLQRERDEARAQRDAWEKVALREASKMGDTLLGGAK